MNTLQSILVLGGTLFTLTAVISGFPGLYKDVRYTAVREADNLVKAQEGRTIYHKFSGDQGSYPESSPARLLVTVEQLKDLRRSKR